MSHDRKQFLNLAGEFLVAGMLNAKFIHASVTYGASKSADVIAHNLRNDEFYRIEVKTTDKKQWIVGRKLLDDANWKPNHFWILVYLPIHGVSARDTDEISDEMRGAKAPRFFIFTARELGILLRSKHSAYRVEYRNRHGRDFDDNKGVYTISLAEVSGESAEGSWLKIQRRFLTGRLGQRQS